MHITLTGNLGSGKSTIGKLMTGKYGYEIYSTGKIQRELAAERGLTVLEMNELMKTDHSFDNLIDEMVTKISLEKKDDIFFDSRLAWHFAVNTFKVFLSVSPDEAAKRVFNDDNRGEVEKYASVGDAKAQLLARARTEDERYRDIYGIDYFNMSNYNLILDSTFTAPELLAEVLMTEKQRYEELCAAGNPPTAPRILLAPARLAGLKSGNTSDNSAIFESDATVRMVVGDIEVISGADEIARAAAEGYEFISVKI